MRLNFLRRPLLSALGAACLLLPGLAAAQSLQSLYDAARAFDATYLAARANADAARYRAEQAEALGRPRIDATANAIVTANDPVGTHARAGATVNGSVTGRYPLFNRPNASTIAQARKLLESAQADLETAEQELLLRVSQAYFDVLGAQDTLATTRASKSAITEQLASAKRNFEVGTATITDTREAQARFDLGTAQELAAENDLRTKRLALDTLVGQSGVTPRSLVIPVALAPAMPANPEEWVTTADQQHPAVRRARIALEVAQLEAAKARGGALPTLDAVASVSSVDSRGPYPDYTRAAGISASAFVGVQMNWALYTGGAVQNRIRETSALEEKSRQDLEAARRGVAQSTRVAYFNLQSGLAQVKALEAAESSSKLALEATQLGYRVGVRVNLDVLNSQSQLFTVQRDLARSRYDALIGNLRLRQASGQLSPTDIDLVNRLLVQ